MRGTGDGCVGMHSVGFYHGNGATLFAEAPHSTLAIESRGACDTKFRDLRTTVAESTGWRISI